MISIGAFQPYLHAILDSLHKEEDLGDRYIPTQAELPLQVQTYEFCPEDQEQSQLNEPQLREQLVVLDGLRKYASEQVLLVGKPGSGKSTALRRLWYEESENCALEIEHGHKRISPIPVLLNLKEFREGAVLELIQKSIQRHRLRLTLDELEDFLYEGQLLLLLDGLNELPNQEAWRKLDIFRSNYPDLPMIFTTRELGAYANLGIVKKLEMMPLSKIQMQEFVQKRLPKAGKTMWQQVQGRVQELAETPLLLQMLCDTFAEKGKIPESRGELFRKEFTRRYENFKPSRRRNITDESGRSTGKLLCYLASKMVQGLPHTDPCKPSTIWLTISKTEAETILATSLAGDTAPNSEHEKNSKEWLEDLLEWDLLQVANEDEHIEFHHQLFQEYYAAEWLFSKLKDLNDEELKYYYLNYLKWTEPLMMAMAFLESREEAENLIKLALNIDLSLGARLAGEVKPQFHTTVVESIGRLEVAEYLKVELLGKMRSNATIPKLLKAFKNEDSKVAGRASGALVNLGSDQSVLDGLREALEDENPEVRRRAVNALGQLGPKQAISDLSPILEEALKDSDSEIRRRAVMALEKLSSEESIPALIEALCDPDSEVCGRAANALGNLGAKEAIPALREIKQDTIHVVRRRVAVALRKLESDQLIPSLVTTPERKNKSVRGNVSDVLEKLRIERAIPFILTKIEPSMRIHAAKSLRKRSTIDVIRTWFKLALKDDDNTVRMNAANALGEINTIDVIRIWSELADLVPTSLGDAAFKVMSGVQFDCKFYNYDIAQSPPPKLLNNQNTQGVTKMTNNFNFDQRGATIGVNVANEGSTIKFIQQAKQNIHFPEQNLADAVQKIEALLTQLAQTCPTTTESQQQTFTQKFLKLIESAPNLVKVLLAGGIEGLKILCPPAGIPIEMARSLYEVVQQRNNQP
jgi:HEAT repeat protein